MMLHLFVSIILLILTIAKTDSIDKSPSIVSSILTFFSPITSLLATKITSSTSITSTTYTTNNLRASQKLSETKEEKNNESIIIGEPIVEVIDEAKYQDPDPNAQIEDYIPQTQTKPASITSSKPSKATSSSTTSTTITTNSAKSTIKSSTKSPMAIKTVNSSTILPKSTITSTKSPTPIKTISSPKVAASVPVSVSEQVEEISQVAEESSQVAEVIIEEPIEETSEAGEITSEAGEIIEQPEEVVIIEDAAEEEIAEENPENVSNENIVEVNEDTGILNEEEITDVVPAVKSSSSSTTSTIPTTTTATTTKTKNPNTNSTNNFDDDSQELDDDEEFFQPTIHDDDTLLDESDMKTASSICRRIDNENYRDLKMDHNINLPLVNMSKLNNDEDSFMDCFTLYNSCLDKNNFIVILAKDEDEISTHLGSLSTDWFSVKQCNASAPSKTTRNQRVVIPLSIRPLMPGEESFNDIKYDECSNGLIILSDYLESFGHTYYVASQLLSLFQRKVITSAVSLIPVSGLSLRLEAFQKGLFSLLPIYRLIDWSISVTDATVKRGTKEFMRKFSSDSSLSKCFKKLEVCRICSKDNLPGVLDSATKLGMLAQEKYGQGYPQDSGYQKWQSPNDSSAGSAVPNRPGVHLERAAYSNTSNWKGLPKLVLTIVQKQNSLGKIMNLVDILYYCGKGVVLNTTDLANANSVKFTNINVESTTDKTGLVVLICRVHEVGKRLLDDLQIASSTDILLGVHGEGLINTLFIRPSGHLIEVRPCGVFNDVASKYEKMADYQSSYAWRFFWLVKYVNKNLCGNFNSHEHNVILPIDRLRSLLIRIATVKNDRNNYVNYYQKKEHILLL